MGLDVAGERDRVVSAGWPLDADLTERPWGLLDFRLYDPDGHYLRVTSRRAAPARDTPPRRSRGMTT